MSKWRNGYDEIGWNELSGYEQVHESGTANYSYTCDYDGFIIPHMPNGYGFFIKINSLDVGTYYTEPNGGSNGSGCYAVKKGDVVDILGHYGYTPALYASWYKKRS